MMNYDNIVYTYKNIKRKYELNTTQNDNMLYE